MKSNGAGAADHFSQQAEQYQKASDSGLWRWWRRKEAAAIFAVMQPRRGWLVLDAGCGAGQYSRQLQERGARVIACDLVPAMVAAARRQLAIPSFAADLHTLMLAPAFDAILCAGALEFCADPETALRCMASGLGCEGELTVMLPHDGLSALGYQAFHRSHGVSIQLFSGARLSAMADSAGLLLRETRTIGFNTVAKMIRQAP